METHSKNTQGTHSEQNGLLEAVKQGHTETVRALLDDGAECKTSNSSQNLIAVALQNHDCPPDLIQLLLNHGVSPNDHDGKCENIPLLCVNLFYFFIEDPIIVKRDNIAILQLLLHHGANLNVSCNTWDRHRTPLSDSVRAGWTAGVKILLDAGALCRPSGTSQNLLAVALHNRDCPTDLIQLLLQHGVSPNDHDGQCENIPLLCVNVRYNIIGEPITLRRDNVTILQLLLHHGANPHVSYRHRTPLCDAVSAGWTEGVKTLIDAGAQCRPFGKSQNLLALALANDDCPTDLIQLLLKHGVSPNDHDGKLINIPLFCVSVFIRLEDWKEITRDNTAILQLLLQNGAEPNVSYIDEQQIMMSPLCDFVRLGWTEGVKILPDAGAEIKLPGVQESPLVIALKNSHCPDDLIKLLLEHGADPNDHEDGKDAPLVNAVAKRRGNCEDTGKIHLLLEHGAHPNVAAIVDKSDWIYGEQYEYTTALHEAARQQWTEGVRMLLDAGAKCVSSDTLQNPLVLALDNIDCPQEVIELLLRQGAVNCKVLGAPPLLHRILRYIISDHSRTYTVQSEIIKRRVNEFCNMEKVLDLFFIHGGNINVQDHEDGTALQYAVIRGGSMNMVRWLIRHGAESILPCMSILDFAMLDPFPALLLLLQAGMRVSHDAHAHLCNMELELSDLLKKGTASDQIVKTCLSPVWTNLLEEEANLLSVQCKVKDTISEYCVSQMLDLKEFSNESLHVYPEDTYPEVIFKSPTLFQPQTYEEVLCHLGRVLEFLGKPQSLQWHCRLCVRESLVSLQPSVVKTLPLPSKLKRCILCHEI